MKRVGSDEAAVEQLDLSRDMAANCPLGNALLL
jgi:hypothetical protein